MYTHTNLSKKKSHLEDQNLIYDVSFKIISLSAIRRLAYSDYFKPINSLRFEHIMHLLQEMAMPIGSCGDVLIVEVVLVYEE